jgi:hypothetical protein
MRKKIKLGFFIQSFFVISFFRAFVMRSSRFGSGSAGLGLTNGSSVSNNLSCVFSLLPSHYYLYLASFSRVLSLVSCVLCLESCVLHLVSCVLCLVSCVLSLASCILCLASCVMCLESCVLSLASPLNHFRQNPLDFGKYLFGAEMPDARRPARAEAGAAATAFAQGFVDHRHAAARVKLNGGIGTQS